MQSYQRIRRHSFRGSRRVSPRLRLFSNVYTHPTSDSPHTTITTTFRQRHLNPSLYYVFRNRAAHTYRSYFPLSRVINGTRTRVTYLLLLLLLLCFNRAFASILVDNTHYWLVDVYNEEKLCLDREKKKKKRSKRGEEGRDGLARNSLFLD